MTTGKLQVTNRQKVLNLNKNKDQVYTITNIITYKDDTKIDSVNKENGVYKT